MEFNRAPSDVALASHRHGAEMLGYHLDLLPANHRNAFTGKGRFVNLEGYRLDDPYVGRNDITRFNRHDVTRDEVLRRDFA